MAPTRTTRMTWPRLVIVLFVTILTTGCGAWLPDTVSRVQEAELANAATITNARMVPATDPVETSASAVEVSVMLGGTAWRLVCVGEAVPRCNQVTAFRPWYLERGTIRSEDSGHYLEVQNPDDLRPLAEW